MRRRRFRPFRLGLWLGALAGAAWFARRYQRTRDEAVPGAAPAPAASSSTLSPFSAPTSELAEVRAPVVPIVRPEIVEVGDVEQPGEPEVGTVDVETTPPPEQVPAARPRKKAEPAAKKAEPAAKKVAAKKAGAPAKSAGAPAKKAAPRKVEPWVVPDPGGVCPTSHPVKAKLASKLFHLPGMFAYARTNPDRCYLDEAAAEADGLRKAKR